MNLKRTDLILVIIELIMAIVCIALEVFSKDPRITTASVAIFAIYSLVCLVYLEINGGKVK